MRERFERYINQFDFEGKKYFIFIVEDENSKFVAFVWFYISQGDLGSEKYVWILDIGVKTEYKDENIETLLVRFVEQWTIEHELKTIRLGVHTQETLLIRILEKFDYRITNLFLYNRINYEDVLQII